ncbi:hypothetical protein MLD38_021632 [Melastoma candidum]|uniref:Uncharacterized protein n=1 Tax=Melastoma candidum TaxID=119954 RepID=A0ACB9QII1_9MYRT|nr:hypothetical protein MLD38_021632 [Melastoma candidum]
MRGDDSSTIHVAMTLDPNYLRGTTAAVMSILQHEPEAFVSINSTFPYLRFRVYRFDSSRVRGKTSKSIRQALDQPLNFARIYLADLIPISVRRMIYLDSDLVVADNIAELWEVDLEGKFLAASEYCHANFTKYFTDLF